MVTKIVTANDVDNVTIIINPQNKLEAKIPPATTGAVEIEEIPNTSPVTARVITIDGTHYQMSKVGVIKGTEWLVFQLKDFVPAITPPPAPEPEQPSLKQYQLSLKTTDEVGTYYYTDGQGYSGLNYKFWVDVVDNATSNLLDPSQIKILKFTASASNTSKTFEVPYMSPYIVDFSDFEDSGADSGFGVSNVSVVLQDGTEIFAYSALQSGTFSALPA